MFQFQRQHLLQSLTSTLVSMMAVHTDMQQWLAQVDVNITESQFDKLSKYLQLLRAKNDELNLTRITDVREAWIKHILDSLMTAIFFSKTDKRVVDIGTGGGLPGIPLAILFPSVQFTLVDSTEKKVNAVQEFAHELNLKNVHCITSRIENLGRNVDHRGQYDIVIARALAPLRVLVELAVPLIHPYGHVLAYKGPEYISELGVAKTAIEKLRAEPPRVIHYSLPEGMGERTIIDITKKTVTDERYPRRDGMPAKSPL